MILIELNEKSSFVTSNLEYFPRLMTQKGERMERHGGVRDNERMRVRFHCHDWLSKCHKFYQRRGEEMLGAAFLFYQARGARATFIILQGEEWKVRTGPGFDYLSPACLREEATRGRAPATIQPWRAPRVRPGSTCHSLTRAVVCWQSNRWHEITALQRPDLSLSKLISHWPTLKIQIYSHKGHRIDRTGEELERIQIACVLLVGHKCCFLPPLSSFKDQKHSTSWCVDIWCLCENILLFCRQEFSEHLIIVRAKMTNKQSRGGLFYFSIHWKHSA